MMDDVVTGHSVCGPETTTVVAQSKTVRMIDASCLFTSNVLTESRPIADYLSDLFPEERAQISAAVFNRQCEFATGRICARSLLGQFGYGDVAILSDEDRVPVWPPGIKGSITHSGEQCVVAVSRDEQILSVGVDLEPCAPIEPNVWSIICTDAEIDWTRRQPSPAPGILVRMIFSAKEAAYKALFPLTRSPLELKDVQVTWGDMCQSFRVTVPEAVLPECHLSSVDGTTLVTDRWIVCGAQIPSRAAMTESSSRSANTSHNQPNESKSREESVRTSRGKAAPR